MKIPNFSMLNMHRLANLIHQTSEVKYFVRQQYCYHVWVRTDIKLHYLLCIKKAHSLPESNQNFLLILPVCQFF